MSPETRHLRGTAALLRRVAPLAGPVVVRVCDLPGLHGEAVRSASGRQVIRIARGLGPDLTRDTLIHEWAHLRAWERHGVRIADHGRLWGQAFAEVYAASLASSS